MNPPKQYGLVQQGSNQHFDDVPILEISEYPWDTTGYRPKTYAQVYADPTGLFVHMRTEADALSSATTQQLTYVHTSSCLEFFVQPYPEEDNRYFNFEISPLGITYGSVGEERHNRQLLTIEDVALMNIRSSIVRGKTPQHAKWDIFYEIPYQLIGRYFAVSAFSKGHVMRGNFYKCGEEAEPSHYGSWSPIGLEAPDFHCPEFFGDILCL